MTRWSSAEVGSGIVLTYDYRRLRGLATLADLRVTRHFEREDPNQQPTQILSVFPFTAIEISFLSASRLGVAYLFSRQEAILKHAFLPNYRLLPRR